MSHFTVLVIGDNIEAQLAPFQENNMGDCPKQYLEFIDHTKEVEEGYAEESAETKAKYDDIDDYARDYYGYRKDPETGRYGRWENPNRKWDWYIVGGRWTGFFTLKEGRAGTVGYPGFMTPEAEDGKADQARKGDIDFEAMRDACVKRALRDYDNATRLAEGTEAPEAWESLRDRLLAEGKNMEEVRIAYGAQPRVKAFRTKEACDLLGYMSDYPEKLSTPRDDVASEARGLAGATFAVLKDGEWYERGVMGWWGMVHDEKKPDTWAREFAALLDSLPDDTLLTVVDCHI